MSKLLFTSSSHKSTSYSIVPILLEKKLFICLIEGSEVKFIISIKFSLNCEVSKNWKII